MPEQARRRTYAATVSQTGQNLTVFGSGDLKGDDRFVGVLDPTDDVTFTIGGQDPFYYYLLPGIVERLTPTSELQIAGFVTGTATSNSIRGSLDGFMNFWDFTPGSRRFVTCNAAHQFEMRRQ